jgi:hypothetical protein
MKKLLLLSLSLFTSAAFAQVTYTAPTPKYGCPNMTHDVTIGVTNTSGTSIPPGVTITVTDTIKDNTNTLILGKTTQSFSTGFANGATHYFTITGVAFVGPMICNTKGKATILGTDYPFTGTYTVQYPPDLSISESPVGTIAVATPLDGYSVRYYLNANYGTVNNETTSTTYTPGVIGSYTAKGYDPATTCISVNPSNAVVISAASGIQNSLAAVVNIYPNPASDLIYVGLENTLATQAEMTLTDIAGLKIATVNFKNQGGALSAEMPISHLAEGIYLLHIKTDAGVTCKKITKR